MISTSLVKSAMRWILSVMTSAVVVSSILVGVAVVVRASTGASVSDAFSETAVVPTELAGEVIWQPDTQPLVREVEPRTREALEGAWVRALSVLSGSGGGSFDLHSQADATTWFSGRALQQFDDLRGQDLSPVAFTQNSLAVDFYSADGQIVVIEVETTATTALPLRPGPDEDSAFPEVIESRENFTVLFILQDGNWKIEQIVRRAPSTLPSPLGDVGQIATGAP